MYSKKVVLLLLRLFFLNSLRVKNYKQKTNSRLFKIKKKNNPSRYVPHWDVINVETS